MGKHTAVSFIAVDTQITGNIQSNARLIIEGSISGNIKCSEITISSTGRVTGDLHTGEVFVAGAHTGTIIANKKLTIKPTGLVEGKIVTRSLIIEEGGRVEGDIKVITSVEDLPIKTP